MLQQEKYDEDAAEAAAAYIHEPGDTGGENGENDPYGVTQEEPTGFEILDAPDFNELVRGKQTQKSKAYEQRVNSMLKHVALGATRAGNLPDAAVAFKYGPKLARAAGDMTDDNAWAAKAIDMMSAPDNPTFIFGLLAVSAVAQLFRNHETDIQQIQQIRKLTRAERKQAKRMNAETAKPGKRIEIKLPLGKKISLAVNLEPVKFIKFLPKAIVANTKTGGAVANEVFGNPDLQKALRQYGLYVTVKEPEE